MTNVLFYFFPVPQKRREYREKKYEQSDLAKDAEINHSNDNSGAVKHESIPESKTIPTTFLTQTLQSICTKELINMFDHNQVKQQIFTLKQDDSDELKTFIPEEPRSEVNIFFVARTFVSTTFSGRPNIWRIIDHLPHFFENYF